MKNRNKNWFFARCIRKQYYDGDGGAGDGGAGDGGAGDGTKPKTFTQEQLNKFLADDRRKNQAKLDQVLADAKALREGKEMTEQEKADLAKRLEELENSSKTKEQLAAEKEQKLLKTHKEQLDSLTGETTKWKTLYTDSTISRELSESATEHKAISPMQVVALLKPNTRLAEDVDKDGKPTGKLIARVKYLDNDKDGNPIELDLSVKEAVKRMSDSVDKYGNLFQGKSKEGMGGGGSGSGTKFQGDQASWKEVRKSLKD